MSVKASAVRQPATPPASGSAAGNKSRRTEVEEASIIVSSASSGSESGSDEPARPAMRPKPETNIPAACQRRRRSDAKFVGRISMLIMACPSLQSLGLRMNGVHSYALAAMAHALSGNQGLRRLDLSCNPLTTHPSTLGPANAGIRALARALRAGCKLETLDLSFCGLGNRDADLLETALKHNKALGKIPLGGNPIAPDHAIFKDSRVVRIASARTDD